LDGNDRNTVLRGRQGHDAVVRIEGD
jgi:hypothetical protein